MRVSTLLLTLLATTTTQVLSAPLPTFNEIERRWSAGETDATIHAHHNPRSASPSWPLARDSEPAFAFDARTLSTHSHAHAKRANDALYAKMRDFADRLMGKERGFIAERSAGEEAEVRLRKGREWHFRA